MSKFSYNPPNFPSVRKLGQYLSKGIVGIGIGLITSGCAVDTALTCSHLGFNTSIHDIGENALLALELWPILVKECEVWALELIADYVGVIVLIGTLLHGQFVWRELARWIESKKKSA